MIGILGGTFDPPHNGHVALARAAREKLPIDDLVILVEESPGHRGVIAGNADSMVAPRCPLIRIMYGAGAGSMTP